MSVRLNPKAEKSASISVHIGGRECVIAPAKNAATASGDFNLNRGETCKMTNTGSGRAYVYVSVNAEVEVVIGSETDKLYPAPEGCGSVSQMYDLRQGVVAEFRAV